LKKISVPLKSSHISGNASEEETQNVKGCVKQKPSFLRSCTAEVGGSAGAGGCQERHEGDEPLPSAVFQGPAARWSSLCCILFLLPYSLKNAV